jgi:hypothetical protein
VLDEPASAPFFSGLKPSKTRNSGDRLRNFSNDPTHKGEEKKRKERKKEQSQNLATSFLGVLDLMKLDSY